MKRVYCLKLQFAEPVVVVMCLRMHLGVIHYFSLYARVQMVR